MSSFWGKRDSRRDRCESIINTLLIKERIEVSKCRVSLATLECCSRSTEVFKIMKPNHAAKTDREASLSPPPLKKRRVESTTTSRSGLILFVVF